MLGATLDDYSPFMQEDPENPRRGCTTGLFYALLLLVLVLCCSCSRKVVEHTIVRTDTTYITKQQRDSIWLHDSIYLHEWLKGDTVYLELTKWHTKYIERQVHDTLYQSKRDTIQTTREVEKKLTRWQRMRLRLGDIMLVLLLALGVYLVLKLKKFVM